MKTTGEAVVHDAFQLYNHFFDTVLDANYASPTASFETIAFIRKNLSVLCYRTPLLQKYFPNIFKVKHYLNLWSTNVLFIFKVYFAVYWLHMYNCPVLSCSPTCEKCGWLQILAWNPRTFLSEMIDVIPAFLSPTTSLEVGISDDLLNI